MAGLPLEGLVVADFSRVLAGPLSTAMLGDAGARVVKIEEPGRGDETRRWGPPFVDGVSAYFLSVNRNKESIGLDLAAPAGRRIARELVRRADVVVDNFLPAQRERLGLTAASVRRLNRRAVHCSISGYDPDTPDAATPGYDLLAQAGAGLMAITGEAEGDPMKIGVALSDVLTAHHAFGMICAALVERARTGKGRAIEVSLFSSTLASLVNVAQNALVTGREARRWGNAHPSIVPYQLFHGSDRPFAIGVGTDRHFVALCGKVLRRPELASDPRFATNAARVEHRAALLDTLESEFVSRPARQWIERCRKASIPVSPVRGPLEALRSPAGKGVVAEASHRKLGRYETVRHPALIDGERLPVRRGAPELGEHTDAILREMGLSGEAVARLRERGVIG